MRENGRVVSVAALIATGVNTDGRREILGLGLGPSEAAIFWLGFLRGLEKRGLKGTRLVISDAHGGLKAAIALRYVEDLETGKRRLRLDPEGIDIRPEIPGSRRPEPLTIKDVLPRSIIIINESKELIMTDSIELLGSTAGLTPDRRSILVGMGVAVALPGSAWAAPSSAMVSRTFSTPRHTTHYLESGPADGSLMIFLHGWPELGLMWRAQVDAFAADGWRCVAPDLRGYGGSSAPAANDAYTIEQVVADMAQLHDHLGGKPAIWVGHDWGSVVAGQLVAHQPERSRGVVLVAVPYFATGNDLQTLVPLVDRKIYPIDRYPDGQWDYYRYYNRHFDAAVADLDADKASSLASVFQPGNPANLGKPSLNAMVTSKGGRFGAAHRAPPTKPDPTLWPPADFATLLQSFKAHGFRPACAWYLNDDANHAYALEAPDRGRITQPVLYVNGDYDQTNTIVGNGSGDPMRAACSDLTVVSLSAAHWLPLERKAELIQAMRAWLRQKSLTAA